MGLRVVASLGNRVFDELIKNGKVVDCAQILKKMGEKEPKPDASFYEAVIKGLCNEGELDTGRDLLEEMVRYGIGVPPALQQFVNEVFGEAGRGEEIQRVLNTNRRGYQPLPREAPPRQFQPRSPQMAGQEPPSGPSQMAGQYRPSSALPQMTRQYQPPSGPYQPPSGTYQPPSGPYQMTGTYQSPPTPPQMATSQHPTAQSPQMTGQYYSPSGASQTAVPRHPPSGLPHVTASYPPSEAFQSLGPQRPLSEPAQGTGSHQSPSEPPQNTEQVAAAWSLDIK